MTVKNNVEGSEDPPPQAPVAETSLLISLAQTIMREAGIVDQYLKSYGGEYPSFEANGLADLPKLPDDVLKARHEVLRATTELKDLITGPSESLRWMAWDVSDDELVGWRRLGLRLGCGSSMIRYHYQL